MQEEGKNTNSGKRKKRKGKKKNPTLTPPFRWRCRVCSQEGEANQLDRHCGQIVKQLAPVSKEGMEWFNGFLENNTWKFISPNMLLTKPHSLTDEERVSLACKAGNELETLLQEISLTSPSHYELYTPRSDHLRISDLKKPAKTKWPKRGIDTALNTAFKWNGKTIPPSESGPKGGSPEELGHIFDEFFKIAFENMSSGLWFPGKRVDFYCEELDLTVGGTPDLIYEGIPVEMKTTARLPTSKMKNKSRKNFASKWRTNYLPQIAMYSHACELEWMFLLLISKETGEFSIIPVNGKEKMKGLRQKWKSWVDNGGKLMENITRYRKLGLNEEE